MIKNYFKTALRNLRKKKLYSAINIFGLTVGLSACLLIGEKNMVVMLFDEPTFKNFISNDITIANHATEVLLSIDAESKEEVDEMAQKAVNAGGTSSHKPGEMKGWMYGCVFADIDGHHWNVLYMDMGKMPKG